jgi:integrase
MTLAHSGSDPSRAVHPYKPDDKITVPAVASRVVFLPEWVSAESWQADNAYRLAAWLRTRDLWLAAAGRNSARSAREYARIWNAFFASHSYKLAPWEVDSTHAQEWAADLATGHAPATVNKSLAILSSYYRFCGAQYDHSARLWAGENPFAGEHLRARVPRFGRARYPSTDQVLSLCAAIDTSSPAGLRDLCLIRGMFATTRRLNEWLNLRWGDIAGNTFACVKKGGQPHWQYLPDGLKDLLVAWLHAAGNWPPSPSDYLFVRTNPYDWSRPLNPGNVWRIMRKYGAQAGVPLELCHPHGLRHAGARERKRQNATPLEMQTILGHQHFSTTEIYIREVCDSPVDRLADAMDALFERVRTQPSRALG